MENTRDTQTLVKNLQRFVKRCRQKNSQLLKYNTRATSDDIFLGDVNNTPREMGKLHRDFLSNDLREDEKEEPITKYYSQGHAKIVQKYNTDIGNVAQEEHVHSKNTPNGDEKEDNDEEEEEDSDYYMVNNTIQLNKSNRFHSVRVVDDNSPISKKLESRKFGIANSKAHFLSNDNITNQLMEDDLELQFVYKELKSNSKQFSFRKKKKKKKLHITDTNSSIANGKTKTLKLSHSTKSLKNCYSSHTDAKKEARRMRSAAESSCNFVNQMTKKLSNFPVKRALASMSSEMNNVSVTSHNSTKRFAEKLISFRKGFMERLETQDGKNSYNIGCMYMSSEISEDEWSGLKKYKPDKLVMSSSKDGKTPKGFKFSFATKGSMGGYTQVFDNIEEVQKGSRKKLKGAFSMGRALASGSGTDDENVLNILNFLLDDYVPRLIGRYETCINKLDAANKMLKQKIRESLDAGDVQYEEIRELKAQLVQKNYKMKKLTDTITMLREKLYNVNELEAKNAEYLDEIVVLKNKIHFLGRALEENENPRESCEMRKIRRNVKSLYKSMLTEMKFLTALKAKYVRKRRKKKFSLHKFARILNPENTGPYSEEEEEEEEDAYSFQGLTNSQKKNHATFVLAEELRDIDDILSDEEEKEEVEHKDFINNEQNDTQLDEVADIGTNMFNVEQGPSIEEGNEINNIMDEETPLHTDLVEDKEETKQEEDDIVQEEYKGKENDEDITGRDQDMNLTDDESKKGIAEEDEDKKRKDEGVGTILCKKISVEVQTLKETVKTQTIGTNTILNYDTFTKLLNKYRKLKAQKPVLTQEPVEHSLCKNCADKNKASASGKNVVILNKNIEDKRKKEAVILPKTFTKLKENTEILPSTCDFYMNTLKNYHRKYFKLAKGLNTCKKPISHKNKRTNMTLNCCGSIRKTISTNINCCICPKDKIMSSAEHIYAEMGTDIQQDRTHGTDEPNVKTAHLGNVYLYPKTDNQHRNNKLENGSIFGNSTTRRAVKISGERGIQKANTNNIRNFSKHSYGNSLGPFDVPCKILSVNESQQAKNIFVNLKKVDKGINRIRSNSHMVSHSYKNAYNNYCSTYSFGNKEGMEIARQSADIDYQSHQNKNTRSSSNSNTNSKNDNNHNRTTNTTDMHIISHCREGCPVPLNTIFYKSAYADLPLNKNNNIYVNNKTTKAITISSVPLVPLEQNHNRESLNDMSLRTTELNKIHMNTDLNVNANSSDRLKDLGNNTERGTKINYINKTNTLNLPKLEFREISEAYNKNEVQTSKGDNLNKHVRTVSSQEDK